MPRRHGHGNPAPPPHTPTSPSTHSSSSSSNSRQRQAPQVHWAPSPTPTRTMPSEELPRRQGTWPPVSDSPVNASGMGIAAPFPVADAHDHTVTSGTASPAPSSSRRSSNDTSLRNDGIARPPFPSLSTGPARKWSIPTALSLDVDAKAAPSPSSPVQGDAETFVTHSPITPTTTESNVHRRRMSVGPGAPVLGRRRSWTTLVDRSSAAGDVPAHGSNAAPPRSSFDAHRNAAAGAAEPAGPLAWQPPKPSPMVNEYTAPIETQTTSEHVPKQPRRKHWPSVCDTSAMGPPTPDPLPQDPNHLLPLSTPPTGRTPVASPSAVSDAATDYIGLMDASSDDGAPPRASTSSPRTSTSTSSSRWEQRAYSQSSESEDDEDLPEAPSWWFRSHDGASSSRVTASLLPSAPGLLPVGTRHWGWLLGPLHRVLPATTTEAPPAPKRRSSKRRKAQLSEKEKVIDEPWSAAKILRLLRHFVRNEPWGVVSCRCKGADGL